MSVHTTHSPPTRESRGVLRFGAGFGLGLLLIPAALVANDKAGATVGWAVLVVLTLAAALAGGRFSVHRALGVLSGLLTVVAAGFLLLLPLLFAGDW